MGSLSRIETYPAPVTANFTSVTTPATLPSNRMYAITNATWVSGTRLDLTTSTTHDIVGNALAYIVGLRGSAGNIDIRSAQTVSATGITANTLRVENAGGTAFTYTAGTGVVYQSWGTASGVKFVNNLWFIMTTHGGLGYSADGITWTWVIVTNAAGSGSGIGLYDIAFGNGTYVASSSDINGVFTSTNLTTWTYRSTSANQTYSVEWFPSINLFLIGNLNGEVMSSPDGITWTARYTLGSGLVQQFATDGTNIVAVNNSGGDYPFSTNGTSWTAKGIGSNWRGNYLFYDNVITNRWHWMNSNTGGFQDADLIGRNFSNNNIEQPAITDQTSQGGQQTITNSLPPGRRYRYYRPTGLFMTGITTQNPNTLQITKSTRWNGTSVSNTQGGQGYFYPETVYNVPMSNNASSVLSGSNTYCEINSAGTQALITCAVPGSTRNPLQFVITLVTFQ